MAGENKSIKKQKERQKRGEFKWPKWALNVFVKAPRREEKVKQVGKMIESLGSLGNRC